MMKFPLLVMGKANMAFYLFPTGNAVFDIQFFLNNELPEPYSFERKRASVKDAEPSVDDKRLVT